MSTAAHPFLVRLQQATESHDLDALVDCFDPGYRNETPAHPGRSFEGVEQVRANWSQIFAFVPDIRSRIVREAVDGSEVWSEWEMSGTRLDGTAHLMRGVVIFGLQDGRAITARFYLEPVDQADDTVDDAVRAELHADGPQ
jgi:limonene-1,2-epoxide hydrolase